MHRNSKAICKNVHGCCTVLHDTLPYPDQGGTLLDMCRAQPSAGSRYITRSGVHNAWQMQHHGSPARI